MLSVSLSLCMKLMFHGLGRSGSLGVASRLLLRALL
jgi:hypothetical protein